VFATVCALAVTATATAADRPGDLSPRLAELSSPAVRALPPARQAHRLSLAPSGAGALLRQGRRVLVEVRFAGAMPVAVQAVRRAGGRVVHRSGRYRTLTVAALPSALPAIAATRPVRGVIESLAPLVRATCPSGSIVSEGDAQLGAAAARADFGVDGAGVTVGILSDSFDQDAGTATSAGQDVANADLPGSGSPCGLSSPVGILEAQTVEPANASDEGRAMAQIVHDLAPAARILFASAVNGEFSYADNIRRLAAAGASVIADDITYLDEPFFQDGPVAVAANQVSAAGAAYFSAAGNDNLFDLTGEKEIASWEAPAYRETTCPAGLPAFAVSCMDFEPDPALEPLAEDNGFGITVEGGEVLTVDLQWAQPWYGVTTDFDAYLLRAGEVVAESEFPNAESFFQEPFELLSWENPNPSPSEVETVELAIVRCEEKCGEERAAAKPETLGGTGGGDSGAPRLKLALLQNGGGVSATEYEESAAGDVVGPTVFGHSGAAGVIGVGAVRFDNSTAPEYYSSRGPVTQYFGPVLNTTPAPPIAPQVIHKPDLVASDCGANSFFGPFFLGALRFCGTSAAAPHAAAVAALMRQANPGASGAVVRSVLSASARPLPGFGVDQVGAGLIDARAAVNAVALAPSVSITSGPPPLTRERRPIFGFGANRPAAFACSVDGGESRPCASPYAHPFDLADGGHNFTVTATDLGGRVGTSPVLSFRVDTTPPRTTFARRPPRLLRVTGARATVVFRFRSSEPGSTFLCKLDRRRQSRCGARLALRLGLGAHILRVRASDAAGNVDPSPAVVRFRIKRLR
jgi:subtilisin family serine protease